MEQSKALQSLLESADLMKMLEDIIASGTIDRLSPSSLSGMRLTLKSVREQVLSSHDSLASEMISRSKASSNGQSTASGVEVEKTKPAEASFTRRDLRATIEQVRDQ